MHKKLAWAAYLLIIAFFVFCLVWLSGILLPFVIALIIAYVLEPLVTRLHGSGVSRWLGVVAVYSGLIGLVSLFLYYLVPVIDTESRKFVEKFNVVIRDAPRLYERLEGGVSDFLDSLVGEKPEETVSESIVVMKGEDWGFGPDVNRTSMPAAPRSPVLSRLEFGSSEKEFADAGLSDVPSPEIMAFKEGQAVLESERGRDSHLNVEQKRPGLWGVDLGKAGVKIRQTGENTYVIEAEDEDAGAGRWTDVKRRVIGAMRSGLEEFSSSLLSGFFQFFQGLVAGIFNAIVGIVVVFLVGAFAMIDTPRIMNGLRENVPSRYREDLEELLDRLDRGLSGVVRGQLMICLVNGMLSTIGFLIFIPEYAVVLGVLAGLLSLIPIFGTIISSVPAILIALSTGFGHALGVLAWIMGIHFVEAYILNPKIIGSQARIHPIVVILVLIAGEHMYGVKGILLAVPAVSIVQTLIQFTYSRVRRYVL